MTVHYQVLKVMMPVPIELQITVPYPECSETMRENRVNQLRVPHLTIQEGLYLLAIVQFHDVYLCDHHLKIFCKKMSMVDVWISELRPRLESLWKNRDAQDLETYLESPGVADWFVGETILLFAQSSKSKGNGTNNQFLAQIWGE